MAPAAAPCVADGTAVTGSVSEVPKVTGTHDFTIREYSRTKGIGVGKSILSQHFSVDGRRWHIRFYPDGYSTADGGWIALYAQTLHKPQFLPVSAEFTFQLLGPDGDVRPTRRSDRACKYDTLCNSWGIRRYITRAHLESAALGAIHADSITVCCTVTIHKARRRSLSVNRPGLVKMPPPPLSNHGENAIRFLASGKAPFDVRFEVDGEVFEAHRMVVAAQSAWFEGLLYGHGREAGKDLLLEVGGGIVTAEAFRGVLHFIYTDEIPGEAAKGRGSYDVTLRLLVAADYYLIDRLKLMCACRLGDFIKDSTVGTLMEIAEAYSCKDLEQACRNFAARRGLRLLPNLANIQSAIRKRLTSSGAAAPATRRIMDVASTSGADAE
ncbi:BTB/POZ and MATH domain-containing protein 2-like [Triticum dicoccoides]|uniref:BTB/POZ and MATH domain-containing protein 2-like n=1 Tax=Triticum dicoccoides TaxID=85692 RepID=UPI00188DCAFA|nr:BTB/POZ and MATH domain-containing protein 2-like [Triticum dicoccoides]